MCTVKPEFRGNGRTGYRPDLDSLALGNITSAVGQEGVVSTTTVLTLMALVSCDDLQERLVRPMTGFLMFGSQPLVITSTMYHHAMDFTCAFTCMGLSYRYLFRRICTCSLSCLGRARAGVSPPDVRPAADSTICTYCSAGQSLEPRTACHSIVIPNRVQVCPGGPVPMQGDCCLGSHIPFDGLRRRSVAFAVKSLQLCNRTRDGEGSVSHGSS